jgi:hypothetical protein
MGSENDSETVHVLFCHGAGSSESGEKTRAL